jgi:integrase
MYYRALRPEEAAALGKRHLDLPAPVWDEDRGKHVYGWGEMHLDEATPHVGARWTDGGQPRDVRHLKSRAAEEGRTVPVPPELTELLWAHIGQNRYADDGRLFRGVRGGQLPMITYTRAWRAGRVEEALGH